MRTIMQRSVVATPFAGSDSFETPHDESPGLSIAQMLAMLEAHVKLAGAILVSIIALTLVVVKILPKAYEATATLIVSFQVSQGGTDIPPWMIGTYMSTQIELMRGREVLLPVVDQLGLARDPEFTAGFRGGDSGALRNFAQAALYKHLVVEQGRGSQLLYVTAMSRSPVKASQIANAVANAYSSQERQRLKDPADDRARNYSHELAELQDKVKAAQQKVTDLRQSTGVSPLVNENGGPGTNADMQILATLEQQLLQGQSVRRAAESATNMAAIGANGAGSASPLIQQMNGEIASKELQLAQLRATYGPRHPKVVALESDLEQARKNSKEEVRKFIGDARHVEYQLQQAVDTQRQKILAVRRVQDQGAKLQLELESAQSVYKRALDGYDQILFASSGNPSNVNFVSRAPVPVDATKPNKIKLFLVGVILGILSSLIAPVLYELIFDRRIHCRDDFERNFGVPVLAEFDRESVKLSPVSA